ncbi:MAG: archaellin/type IV pilin N-terminal domain-containing protein [Thermoplasmata archaeon]|jgi:flagellin-like protein
MNVFGKNERSWRKARKRGVSPIIATILLVAITVVLAAVLYVLISGLTGGGVGSKPIGSAFSAGNPILSTCAAGSAQTIPPVAATLGGCKAGDLIYTLTVESSTISFSSALFEVKTSSGSIYGGAGAAGGFAIVNIAQNVVAIQVTGATMAMSTTFASNAYGPSPECNSGACSGSTSLTTIYTIVLDMGTTAVSGTGLTFVAIGNAGFTGTTSLSLP